ncbi:hypothetical protein BJV74DRAFT_860247 [Russula compacta]|nr:hypothetical protein BJV74DRAFT_860247 [Russula compacta]
MKFDIKSLHSAARMRLPPNSTTYYIHRDNLRDRTSFPLSCCMTQKRATTSLPSSASAETHRPVLLRQHPSKDSLRPNASSFLPMCPVTCIISLRATPTKRMHSASPRARAEYVSLEKMRRNLRSVELQPLFSLRSPVTEHHVDVSSSKPTARS